MFNGKMKALTFSFDDGVTQDKRLIKIFDKYNLRATFNINSGLFFTGGPKNYNGLTIPLIRFSQEEIRDVYQNHEVASHTLTHPFLNRIPLPEAIRETEEDRVRLSELVGYNVEGMAYPMGTPAMNAEIARELSVKTGVRYARTTTETYGFDVPEDLMILNPSVKATDHENMDALAERFLSMQADKPQIFYIWGHAYEFDGNDDWEWFEDFCSRVSGHDDIFYGTNREIYLGTDLL